MTRILLGALGACLALLAAGCAEREQPAARAGGEPERLDLVLDYTPNPDHAGIYAAMDGGGFDAVRLDVRPRVPSDPAAPLRLLEAGRADLAISYEPEVLLARDRGAKIVAIGALVQQPLTSVMSLGEDPVRRPEDLRGKRIGTAGIPYQDAYLRTILARAGLSEGDVRRIDVGFNLVPAMVGRRVDATLGAFWNVEGVQLERQDRRPTILRVERLGVPSYDELVIVAREEDAARRGQLLRRFMQGLAQGHAALRRDPQSGIAPLLAANRSLDRGLAEASVRATLPAFFPEDRSKPFGWLDAQQWTAYGRWMDENGLLRRREEPARALTNEFLPGEGPQPSER